MQLLQDPYPLFVPPEHLSRKGRRNWTRTEAQEHLAWLTGSLEDRIKLLLGYFGLSDDEVEAEKLLLRLGELVARLLPKDGFSIEERTGARVLSEAGHAVAADLGLFIARCLLGKGKGGVRWQLMRRPKSDFSYNLPVLSGFGRLTLDPVGGSIGEAHGVLAGRRGADAWVQVLQHWSERIDSAPTTPV